MTTSVLSELAKNQFVLLTTFRRTGEAVGTPVWLAQSGNELLITTSATSGKVKRLRHTARVQLVPCSATGSVADGATVVDLRAEVRTDAETMARLDSALESKYGLSYKAIRLGHKLRGKSNESVAVVVTAGGGDAQQ